MPMLMMDLVILRYLVVQICLQLTIILDATTDDGSCVYDYAGCVFPPQFSGNTGVNMTVFLTSGVVSSLPITSDTPYVVATTNLGLVVGSSSLAQEDLIDGQQYLAIFGDDTETPEIDGALAGDIL